MTTEESKDPRYNEGKEECYINYSLTELWDLMDRVRIRCGRYIQSQEEEEQRKKGIRKTT